MILVVVLLVIFIFLVVFIVKAIKRNNEIRNAITPKDTQYKMICNTCGHIWCFTEAERRSEARRNIVNGVAQISSAASGSVLNMAATNAAVNSNKGKETSLTECAACGSKDVSFYTDDKKPQTKTTSDTEADTNSADELKKYKDLLDSGVITQEEFDAKKKQILGL